MNETLFITILTCVLSSGAVFGFIQFMVSRHDSKSDKFKNITDSINKVQDSVDKLRAHIQVDIEEVYAKVEAVSDSIDRVQAINARIRILQAADEISHGANHSREFFDQLNDDITVYEQYCRDNQDFKNNRAVQAIEYVNQQYQERLKTKSFL